LVLEKLYTQLIRVLGMYDKSKYVLFQLLTIGLLTLSFTSLTLSKGSALLQNNATTTTMSRSFQINHITTTTNNNFRTYQNPDYSIKMQYPSDWSASKSGLRDYTNVIAFYSPLENISDIFPEHLTLSITGYSEHITLQKFNTVLNNTLKQPGVKTIESNPTTLAGNPAHKIVFLPPTDNVPFKFETMLVWTVKSDKVYIISYNAEAARYSTYLPTIQKMIDSFEITNSTTTS
jgi:eukaryotic-like serine/threonine-protein kinase